MNNWIRNSNKLTCQNCAYILYVQSNVDFVSQQISSVILPIVQYVSLLFSHYKKNASKFPSVIVKRHLEIETAEHYVKRNILLLHSLRLNVFLLYWLFINGQNELNIRGGFKRRLWSYIHGLYIDVLHVLLLILHILAENYFHSRFRLSKV